MNNMLKNQNVIRNSYLEIIFKAICSKKYVANTSHTIIKYSEFGNHTFTKKMLEQTVKTTNKEDRDQSFNFFTKLSCTSHNSSTYYQLMVIEKMDQNNRLV